ncbi:LLM class flavin-dependent oxidoreductase [Bradyrhizobium viridifuturi]|nr:LLM class flavin-dependent oxidoreductase [Bradyrhizobium viridifuturi]ERF83532.1 MAG: nitrilotriacetate monooxygenase family FMN-dependent oxidoreductase [Bradyrhizobium sp. DFCI-1]MCA3791300.1 LLM class flavin-dependent oxidoreductase [Burkholderia sp.]OYU62628.1 MAG: 5,10-methylene tetrahydromethanopterin reductase [Bradyrhizobium sp. PARBB1]PSO26680.1 FMN-dependent monooxygenase [Bradyrhizobium sp. MOS004]QRI68566.1 LLM class flavin-dependent oxidoreductase [Bradyrhizobium sp. PSBB068]
MPKQIQVNGFAIFSPVHLSPGLWRHPEDRSLDFDTLDYWTDVARILEAGKFDSIFIADGIGIHDVYAGTADAALSSGAQIPKLDPMLLVSAMAHVTEHLGIGVTAPVSYEPPFTLARRFSTLDHLTKGRVAWNIVTGYSNAASRAVGRDNIMPHDPRYDLADEFLDAVYALWEGSWDDEAIVVDPIKGVIADPHHIRKVHHHGAHFKVDAIHLAHPSPQRTPFLFQAGASNRGKDFAARHAEAVFLGEHSKARTSANVAETRARARAFGRDEHDIRFYALTTVIVAETRVAAEAKYRDYQRYIDPKGSLALLSGWTGIDLSRYSLDDPFPTVKKDNAVTSMIDSFSRSERPWTIREIIEHNGIGGRGPVIVGSPAEVADELQAWVNETDIDGFNLSYAVTPGGYRDFAELVVPELQRRGVYKTEYAPGTLREKVFGTGRARLPSSHPAARFRPSAAGRTPKAASA